MLLSSVIPNADEVVSRTPEELACPLLKVLASESSSQRHRSNFLLSNPTRGYPPEYREQIELAITEAWEWLRSHGHLIPAVKGNDPNFVEISRSGQALLEVCDKGAADERKPESDTVTQSVAQTIDSRAEESGSDTIDPHAVTDAPTSRDTLRFKPYVDALAAFLNSKKTMPPLTLSIEGEWGSGKSSFMLQLQEKLQELSPQDTVVWFNPWRYEKQDELWAAFALVLTRTLRLKASIRRRISGDIQLFFKRINGFVAWTKFITFLVLWVVVISGALAVFKWSVTKTPAQQQAIVSAILPESLKGDHDADGNRSPASATVPKGTQPKIGEGATKLTPADDKADKKPPIPIYARLLALGTRGGALAILLAITSLIGKTFRDRMLDFRLERFIDRPDYKGHTAFLDSFHEDFSKAVSAYSSSSHSKIYAFVDDLDRCEVPKAAELIQAINLLIGDGEQLIFILAIDRQKVAAGIAQKFNDLVPFLTEFEEGEGIITVRSKLAFGYSFLEKFIQLSVRVPIQENSEDVNHFLQTLTTSPDESSTSNSAPKTVQNLNVAADSEETVEEVLEEAIDYRRIETGAESERVRQVVLMVRHVFRNNTTPRLGHSYRLRTRLRCRRTRSYC